MANKIPVILCSDDNYAKYLDVTLISILSNASKDTFYDFYILTTSDFSDENKKMIQTELNKFQNNQIKFYDMSDFCKNIKLKKRWKTPTFFRLKAAEILPKEYEKCLYFDVDIIVNIDLWELYNTNLDNNLIAGVRDPGVKYDIKHKTQKLKNKDYKMPNKKHYVNAGVLIMNLKKIREENIMDSFINATQYNFTFADQDILNMVCYDRITLLPLKYNIISYINYKCCWFFYSPILKKEEVKKALNTYPIIHYNVVHKPWMRPKIRLGSQWWSYAAKSSCLNEIIESNSKNKKRKHYYLKQISKYLKNNK